MSWEESEMKIILRFLILCVVIFSIQNGLVYYANLPFWKIIIKDIILMMLGSWVYQLIDSDLFAEAELNKKLITVGIVSTLISAILVGLNWLLGVVVLDVVKMIGYHVALMAAGYGNALALDYFDRKEDEQKD